MRIAKTTLLSSIRKKRQAALMAGGVMPRGPEDIAFHQKVDTTTRGMTSKTFTIKGQVLQKNQVMELLCQEVASGSSLPELCRKPGYPSLRAVLTWARHDGAFKEAFEAAEEARGYVLAERSVELAHTADKETAAAVKVAVEADKWLASKLNHKFSDRQVIKHEHELSMRTDDELRAMVKAALIADAHLVAQLPDDMKKTIGLMDANAEQMQSNCIDVEAE